MSKPKTVIGLVQINNSFSGQNYLPYSIGCLQSFAEAHLKNPDHYEFLLPIFKRMPIGHIVSHLKSADVVGFSTYIWNAKISLAVAQKLKEERPEVIIIFGGPQVPDASEDFLRTNTFIDLVVHNEGEQTFLKLLEAYPAKNWDDIPGISRIKDNGEFVKNPDAERMRDLDIIPSVYASGVFAPLMKQHPKEQWIGLWETNRGCPFQCTFCDWGSAIAAKVNKFGLERLYREIDWFSSNKIEFVFCCDANFGILPRDIELANYAANAKKKSGYPAALSVQSTKNATERAYQTETILSEAGLNKGVSLSMQSLDPVTLSNIKRGNISTDTYLELQQRFTKAKVETYSDLILGLPGETYESFAEGVNSLIESGQHNRIQFNNLSILPNSEMGDPDYQRRFGMITVKSPIINIHGSMEISPDDVREMQDLVIATESMPLQDWRQTRSFCWMTAFLYFDKVLQYPLMLVRELAGLANRKMIEAFIRADGTEFPLIGEIRDFFENTALSIQTGGFEYVHSNEWLNIFWPADEYIFIKLTQGKKWPQFFSEAESLIIRTLGGESRSLPEGLLSNAMRLNQALLNQPFHNDNVSVTVNYDVIGFCNALKVGDTAPLDRPTTITINRAEKTYTDFNHWCQEVVWWGNKKGAYLYNTLNAPCEKQLDGHY